MSVEDKVAAAIGSSLPMLPAELRQQVQAMISPQSLGIIAGTLILWVGSHAFGIGEVVDVVLLWVGYAAIGLSIRDGARELYHFGISAVNAQSSSDLDRAAMHFVGAVRILGVAVVSAVLLRRMGGGARGELGPPENVTYGEGKWWGAHVQSYACLKASLRGEGLNQHHLIPKSLFLKGPVQTRGLIDYVPSVTLDQSEHLSTVHSALNSHLASMGVWQRSLTSNELGAAIRFTKEFYQQRGLVHFAEAVEEFLVKIYSRAR